MHKARSSPLPVCQNDNEKPRPSYLAETIATFVAANVEVVTPPFFKPHDHARIAVAFKKSMVEVVERMPFYAQAALIETGAKITLAPTNHFGWKGGKHGRCNTGLYLPDTNHIQTAMQGYDEKNPYDIKITEEDIGTFLHETFHCVFNRLLGNSFLGSQEWVDAVLNLMDACRRDTKQPKEKHEWHNDLYEFLEGAGSSYGLPNYPEEAACEYFASMGHFFALAKTSMQAAGQSMRRHVPKLSALYEKNLARPARKAAKELFAQNREQEKEMAAKIITLAGKRGVSLPSPTQDGLPDTIRRILIGASPEDRITAQRHLNLLLKCQKPRMRPVVMRRFDSTQFPPALLANG